MIKASEIKICRSCDGSQSNTAALGINQCLLTKNLVHFLDALPLQVRCTYATKLAYLLHLQ